MKPTSVGMILLSSVLLTVGVVACGGDEELPSVGSPTATMESTPATTATAEPAASATATPTPERVAKPRVTVVGLPADLEDDLYLTLSISVCQDAVPEAWEPLFSEKPALEEVRTEFVQVMENLCTQAMVSIHQGASDEALAAVAEDTCAQMTSLIKYAGEYLSLTTCEEIIGEYVLELKEIGVPGASGLGSSRTEPIPLGETATVPPGWEITVLDVNPDAWPVVLAENQFNDPPEEGYRMVLITVRATNVQTGEETDTISEGDFALVGSRNQVYQTFDPSCGVTPNELWGEVFPGGAVEGTVCFQAGVDESDLILIAELTWDKDDRRYLALE